MSGRDRHRHKICHCRPNCNRLLGFDQRKNHYQLVHDPLTIRRSTTPSEHEASDGTGSDSEAESMMEGIDSKGNRTHDGDLDMGMDDILQDLEESYSVISEEDNAGQEAGDGFYDWSDEEFRI
jgi:hypothetical protein